MAEISLKIKSDAEQAIADFKKLASTSEYVQKQIKEFSKSFDSTKIDDFIAKNKLAAVGIQASQGKYAAAKAEVSALQKEMKKLVAQGLDPTSAGFNKLEAELDEARTKMSAFRGAVVTKNSAMLSAIKTMAVYAGGVALVMTALRAVVGGFVDFDHAIVSASAKFSDLDTSTTAGKKKIDELRETARKIGADTEYSAAQAAQGLDYLAMAGFKTNQAISLLPGVVNLATVANTDLARATDIASDSIGAFGMMSNDSAKLAENFTRINDVMAKTITTSNTNMEDLFEAVKKGAPTFVSSSQSLETFNAMLGVLANSGVKGEEAGTQLRNIMLRLAGPTGEAKDLLQRLGIQVQDSSGNFRDIMSIIRDFGVATKGMGTAQRTAALDTIFGARSITGMNILLAEGADKLEQYRAQLEGAGGSSKKMADVMRGSILNQLKALGSAAIEMGFSFIDGFSKQGGGAIKSLAEAVRAITPVFSVLGNILSFILSFMPEIITAWAAYTVVTRGASIATGLMTTAMKVLNFVMSLNPVGLVVAGIAALIAIGIKLYRNWDVISEKLKSIWEGMKYYGAVAWEYIKIGALTAIKWIIEGVMTLSKPFFFVIDNIIKAFNFITGKSVPTLTQTVGKFTASLDNQIAKSQANLSKMRNEYTKQLQTQAQKENELSNASKATVKQRQAQAKEEEKISQQKTARIEAEVAYFKKALETMAQTEASINAERLKVAQDYFAKKLEAEQIHGNDLAAWQAEQANLIANNTKLSFEQRIAAMDALSKAVKKKSESDTANFAKFGGRIMSNASSMFSDLITVMNNAGKSSKAFAIGLKITSAAEAGINSFLAFTQVLRDPTIWPSWLRIPLAGTILAAGLAKQAAIWSTPIAETGLSGYEIPDARPYRNDNYGVRAQAGEKVTVTPRGEDTDRNFSADISIGEKKIFKIMQRGIKTGKINVNNKNIKRGVMAH